MVKVTRHLFPREQRGLDVQKSDAARGRGGDGHCRNRRISRQCVTESSPRGRRSCVSVSAAAMSGTAGGRIPAPVVRSGYKPERSPRAGQLHHAREPPPDGCAVKVTAVGRFGGSGCGNCQMSRLCSAVVNRFPRWRMASQTGMVSTPRFGKRSPGTRSTRPQPDRLPGQHVLRGVVVRGRRTVVTLRSHSNQVRPPVSMIPGWGQGTRLRRGSVSGYPPHVTSMKLLLGSLAAARSSSVWSPGASRTVW
jgi:hypothetical protein